ncbi:MAG: hypothetical protein ACLFQ9_01690 [Desulfobacterales bacterium]
MKEFSKDTSQTGFTDRLAYANGLEKRAGFKRFLFFPGMLFASRQKWWADGGLRPGLHEGLDFCFFEGAGGCRFRLDETARVPAAFDSSVAAVIDDFLGRTVIAKQNLPGRTGQFFILYAHIRPDESVRPGQPLAAGRTFAAVAPAAQNRILPPHLHLSVMPCEKMPSLEKLDWPLLNTLESGSFLDPGDVTGCGGRVIDFHPGINLFDDFARMG